MPQAEFDLDKGVKIGEVVHRSCYLQEADIGILIEAARESEVTCRVGSGRYDEHGRELEEPAILINPYLMELHTLRRQVVKIGDIQGPLELEVWAKLSETDLSIIKAEAETLAGFQLAPSEVALRGRADGQQQTGQEHSGPAVSGESLA